MALAQANLVKIKYVAEATPGVTPATAMKLLNTTGFDLKGDVTTTTSTTIDPSRMTSELVRTAAASQGTVNNEARFGEMDDFVAAALGGAWSTPVSMSAITISAANSDNSFNDSASGFSTANLLPGHWIRVGGFVTAANNGLFRVVSVTAAKVVVSGGTLVDEAAGPTVTVKGSSVRNGVLKPTFSIEQEYSDVAQFSISRGCVVNTLNLAATSQAIVTANFAVMGRDTEWGATTFGTGSDIAANTNQIMSAAANVGNVFTDGAVDPNVFFKSITLDTTNNSRNLDAIGSLYPVEINHGQFGATIATQSYFYDRTLLDKYLNGTPVSLSWSFTDDAGNTFVIDAPYCKFSAGGQSGIALSSDVMIDLTATALKSPSLGYMLQVSRIPA